MLSPIFSFDNEFTIILLCGNFTYRLGIPTGTYKDHTRFNILEIVYTLKYFYIGVSCGNTNFRFSNETPPSTIIL